MAKGNFKKIEARIKEDFYDDIQFRIKSINSNTSKYIQDLIRKDLQQDFKHYKEPIRLNERVEYFKNRVDEVSLENMDLKKEIRILRKLNALPLRQKIWDSLVDYLDQTLYR